MLTRRANDAEALKAALDGSVCALLLEMVQGEGGVNVLDRDFVQTAAALCAERDVLLLIDEVQTGNGRTGTLYAYEQFGVKPDILTTAKGLGGGLPIRRDAAGRKNRRYPYAVQSWLDLRRQPGLRGGRAERDRPHRRRAAGRCAPQGRLYPGKAGKAPRRRVGFRKWD